VAAFVVSSIYQVGRKVFGEAESEAAAADARFPKVGPECAAALQLQIGVIDVARTAAGTEPTVEAAKARYASERGVEAAKSAQIERACAPEPHRAEALAALARLDRAGESYAVREARELSPVRHALQSFISGHSR
jgi:hypothetical protein